MSCRRTILLLALLPLTLAQTAPATRPAVAIDLTTPAAALASYFRAQQALDLDALRKTFDVSDPQQAPYVERLINFRLWRHYLERQAIRRFGKEQGLTVEGHARALDDQLALDLTRLKDAAVEQTPAQGAAPAAAKVFLKVEPDRPAGLQTDRFDFLDTYYLVRTPAGWKVDLLRTFDCVGEDKLPLMKYEAGVFPVVAASLKDLAEGLAKGDYPTAAALKTAYDDRWEKASTAGK
jgi:hypothetical protein